MFLIQKYFCDGIEMTRVEDGKWLSCHNFVGDEKIFSHKQLVAMSTMEDDHDPQSAFSKRSYSAMETQSDDPMSTIDPISTIDPMSTTQSQSQAESQSAKKQKQRATRSAIWPYFDKRYWEPNDDVKWAVCLLCTQNGK